VTLSAVERGPHRPLTDRPGFPVARHPDTDMAGRSPRRGWLEETVHAVPHRPHPLPAHAAPQGDHSRACGSHADPALPHSPGAGARVDRSTRGPGLAGGDHGPGPWHAVWASAVDRFWLEYDPQGNRKPEGAAGFHGLRKETHDDAQGSRPASSRSYRGQGPP